jgi:hypothetical protein
MYFLHSAVAEIWLIPAFVTVIIKTEEYCGNPLAA